jgi:anthranilate phosphoribosyltransferase
MKETLQRLFAHQALQQGEAKALLTEIAQGKHPPAQIAAFMTVYNMRSITVAELDGFREAMLELCIPVPLDAYAPIDLCGTGGDGRDTFNISTLASFVVAGAGVRVAKHGNYGVSSVSGSSNVIEHLGGVFSSDLGLLERCIAEAGICFLHAPLFHPAMKQVGPIRRELGVKTFFNMLGPMVNPAFPQKQLVGVFSLELARLYGYLYQRSGKRFAILHAYDGYDEMSLTGPCKVLGNEGEEVLRPEDLGLRQWQPGDLHGGASVAEAAAIFREVLAGHSTPARREAIIANAALALRCARPGLGLAEAVAAAAESLDSGMARKSFETFLHICQNS